MFAKSRPSFAPALFKALRLAASMANVLCPSQLAITASQSARTRTCMSLSTTSASSVLYSRRRVRAPRACPSTCDGPARRHTSNVNVQRNSRSLSSYTRDARQHVAAAKAATPASAQGELDVEEEEEDDELLPRGVVMGDSSWCVKPCVGCKSACSKVRVSIQCD
jgi:hypothetical protein